MVLKYAVTQIMKPIQNILITLPGCNQERDWRCQTDRGEDEEHGGHDRIL